MTEHKTLRFGFSSNQVANTAIERASATNLIWPASLNVDSLFSERIVMSDAIRSLSSDSSEELDEEKLLEFEKDNNAYLNPDKNPLQRDLSDLEEDEDENSALDDPMDADEDGDEKSKKSPDAPEIIQKMKKVVEHHLPEASKKKKAPVAVASPKLKRKRNETEEETKNAISIKETLSRYIDSVSLSKFNLEKMERDEQAIKQAIEAINVDHIRLLSGTKGAKAQPPAKYLHLKKENRAIFSLVVGKEINNALFPIEMPH